MGMKINRIDRRRNGHEGNITVIAQIHAGPTVNSPARVL
jgi:hypothetical protein